jgi:plasmid stabilization system protein ParE
MTYSLSLRPRALAELDAARDRYALVGQGNSFLDDLEAVFEAIHAMPLRSPIVYGTVHRALLRRYPFAVFFRIRTNTDQVVVLAVYRSAAIQYAGQRADHANASLSAAAELGLDEHAHLIGRAIIAPRRGRGVEARRGQRERVIERERGRAALSNGPRP